jgi:phage gpG-like protein
MKWEVIGFEQAIKHLDQMKAGLKAKKTYDDISNIMVESTQNNFQAGGRDPQWPERKRTYPWPILNKTGKMKNQSLSELKIWLRQGQLNILNVYSTVYAKFHQYGTGRLPVRKFVKLLDQEKEQIINVIKKVFE